MKSLSSGAIAGAPAQICAIFPGALGDFICFLPALHALRQEGLIDLYARSEFSDLAPEGVTVRSLECSEIGELFRPEQAARAAQDRFCRYAAVYSWHGSRNPEFVRRLEAITSGKAQCFAFRPAYARGHQADYYLGCVRPQAARSQPAAINVGAEAARWREVYWTRHSLENRPVLSVAPGSGAREKNWPAQFFATVVEWWRNATGGEVLLLVGPVERELGGLDLLFERCIVAEDLSLAQVAAALTGSVLYLGNDSGISHLAGALGVRTVALFGPSDPFEWAPCGNKVVVLRHGLACSPCGGQTMKICPHRACLREFSAREVISAVARLPEVVSLTR
jgi:ADP-heptose:LPS heptosyltransferase